MNTITSLNESEINSLNSTQLQIDITNRAILLIMKLFKDKVIIEGLVTLIQEKITTFFAYNKRYIDNYGGNSSQVLNFEAELRDDIEGYYERLEVTKSTLASYYTTELSNTLQNSK